MLLLRKVLINLIVLSLILLLLYYYQTSDGVHWTTHTAQEQENVSTTGSNSSDKNAIFTAMFLASKKVYYNVWCIFTKVTSNSPMKWKFEIFAESLLRLSSVDISFHVITDNNSKNIAEKVLESILLSTGKFMKVKAMLVSLILCFA